MDVVTLTPCKTCPFKRDTLFDYAPNAFLQNLPECAKGMAHSCHYSDPATGMADGYTGPLIACAGMLSMQKKAGVWPAVVNQYCNEKELHRMTEIWDSIPTDDSTHTFDSFYQAAKTEYIKDFLALAGKDSRRDGALNQ